MKNQTYRYCFLPTFLSLSSRNSFLIPSPTLHDLKLSVRLGFEVWNTHPNVSFVEDCDASKGRLVTVGASDTIASLAVVRHPPPHLDQDVLILFHSGYLWRGEDNVCSSYRWMTQSDFHTAITSVGILLLAVAICVLLFIFSFVKQTAIFLLLLCSLFFFVFTILLSHLPCSMHWDVSTVTIHEAGHVLGLKHESTSSCRPKDTAPVMHPSAGSLIPFPCVTRSDWYQLFPEEGCVREEVCVTTRVGEAGRNGLLLCSGLSVLATLPFLAYALVKKRKRRRVDDSRVTRQVM